MSELHTLEMSVNIC